MSSSSSSPTAATTSPPPHPPPASASTPTKQATLLDALRTIRPQDFTTFYQKPCARESLLTGIGAGFAVGGVRFISLLSRRHRVLPARSSPGGSSSSISTSSPSSSTPRGIPQSSIPASPSVSPSASPSGSLSLSARVWRSMTWAVLSFTLFSAGAHLFCQRRRKLEHAAMARAAEIVGRKREEKRAEALKRREEREARRREHEEVKVERSRWGRWFGGQNGGEGKG